MIDVFGNANRRKTLLISATAAIAIICSAAAAVAGGSLEPGTSYKIGWASDKSNYLSFVDEPLAKGMEVAHGGWSHNVAGISDSLGELPYIAAIAYKSSDEMPGLWVDAFSETPTVAVAIKALYDEFRDTGEIGDISLEEFVRVANPNVTIVGPNELERFLAAKSPCD